MTLIRHLVLLLSGNTVFLSDVFGGDTHWDEALLGLVVVEDFIGEVLSINLSHHVVVGHGFNTTTNSDFDLARGDLVSNGGNGLKPR